MSELIVPCPHCSKTARLDSARLPEGPASYPCPHCKGKVVVDKRKLMGTSPAPPGPTAPPAAAEPPATPAPPASRGTSDTPVTVASTAPGDRRFARVPADATFPSGIVVGDDAAAVQEVQQQLVALGSDVERVDSAAAARELILNEPSELCVFVGGEIPGPPYPEMAPLTGLPPSFRRRLYLVLVADNLKTLDGTSAFLHQVNMILAKQDLAQLGPALYSGLDYHERLYRPYFMAAEKKGMI